MNIKLINIFSFIIFILISVYSFFVVKGNHINANILSVITSVIVLISLFLNYVFIREDKKSYQVCILLYFLIWSILDLNELLKLTSKQIFSDNTAHIIYIASSLLVVISFLLLIMENIKIIDKKQLVLDFTALCICVYYLMSILSKYFMTTSGFNINTKSNSFLMLTSDVVLIMFTFFTLSIFRFYKTTSLEMVSLLLVFFSNIFKIYYNVKYNEHIFAQILYILPFFAIAVSQFFSQKESNYKRNMNINFINTGNSNAITLLFLVIILIQFLLFKDSQMDVDTIIMVFLANVVYLMVSLKYQNFLIDKTLTRTYEQQSTNLEYGLYEKTQALEKANMTLVDTFRRDVLTGLFSRKYLMEILEGYDTAYVKKDVTIFVIDIIKFKAINELTSHKTGDQVLKDVAHNLKNMFFKDKVFRTDSNEFVVLIEDEMLSDSSLALKSKDITTVLTSPILMDGYTINLEIVIGCDKYSNSTLLFTEVFKNAEYSCMEAKKNYTKEDNFILYNEDMAKKINRRSKIEALLESINFDEEFMLYYQPQFSADGTTLVGMESLLRWQSKDFDAMIPPAEFIPIAEQSNTIVRIVEWTFHKAIEQIKYWNEKYDTDLKMAINISPKYLSTKDFLLEVESIVHAKDIDTKWLDFEITEMSSMSVGHKIVNLFESLHNMGISISVDDFGTGYSSLSYIKSFKIDKLKIAKELIDNIATDKNEYMIVRAIIMMAKGLNIKTIAEGVEEMEQRDELQILECNQIQGYLYGKPSTPENFEKMYIEPRYKK